MVIPKIPPNLQARIISAGILAPLVIAIAWMGGILYHITIIMAASIICFEWSGIINSAKIELETKLKQKWELVGAAYATIFGASLIYLRELDKGFAIVFLMLLFVWATDIAAYFSGKIIGGPKIASKISPNKTWAGLAGGMAASGFIGVFASLFTEKADDTLLMILLGAMLAIIAQCGDFFESWVKRKFGVKDSGTLIPGHGGFMDRLDGVIFVAPLFAVIALAKGGQFFS